MPLPLLPSRLITPVTATTATDPFPFASCSRPPQLAHIAPTSAASPSHQPAFSIDPVTTRHTLTRHQGRRIGKSHNRTIPFHSIQFTASQISIVPSRALENEILCRHD
ncbi:hypothetical protein AOQ84DRAFT_381011 [Glonium stellatum]|uniref:Uncharacterized protein n=1 Tax=Glonium stellatum TaxID=574774 RepID=A0A8E2JNY6_9PEZI|nr:hypothetical protein AOQ84DRAFT_381011 [Glonium stellatum]